eukprot:6184078-Pleurochrysis_carterae.AAC.4
MELLDKRKREFKASAQEVKGSSRKWCEQGVAAQVNKKIDQFWESGKATKGARAQTKAKRQCVHPEVASGGPPCSSTMVSAWQLAVTSCSAISASTALTCKGDTTKGKGILCTWARGVFWMDREWERAVKVREHA